MAVRGAFFEQFRGFGFSRFDGESQPSHLSREPVGLVWRVHPPAGESQTYTVLHNV